jgi:hypothetical protein
MLVPGLPEDRGGVLVGGDRLRKPPHFRQCERRAVSRLMARTASLSSKRRRQSRYSLRSCIRHRPSPAPAGTTGTTRCARTSRPKTIRVALAGCPASGCSDLGGHDRSRCAWSAPSAPSHSVSPRPVYKLVYITGY